MKKTLKTLLFILILTAVWGFGHGARSAFVQTGPGLSYVPLIGITSVPSPLSLPSGAGNVTYNYAVKNFIAEAPLTDIKVSDDKCGPVKFANGDDNQDGKLDYSETWRYTCTARLSQTTQSVATATGTTNDLTGNHNAYATVIVGSNIIPPLVSIINSTKVANPLSLPAEGGAITYTYKVNNPGDVPLSLVSVTDDKCGAMSGKVGDTNGNNLLDINEVWIYTCPTTLRLTTTNTATVTAFANGLTAIDNTTLTVKVATTSAPSNLFDVAITPVAAASPDYKISVWVILSIILAVLLILFLATRKNKLGKV